MSQHAYADAEPYLTKSLHAKPQMLPRIHALIGKAYAETGRFAESVSTAEKALALATAQSNGELTAKLQTELGLYQNHSPCRSKN